MDKLLSDSAKSEISNKVMDILRAYHITNWHSEPYHQNQNPAEWKVQDYQILDQYSDEQIWCPSQLLALMPHLCVLPT